MLLNNDVMVRYTRKHDDGEACKKAKQWWKWSAMMARPRKNETMMKHGDGEANKIEPCP
jgi:hypothetical protein